MRRRVRIDLGQETNEKQEEALNRKRQRWTQRNKDRPESENPFLVKINPAAKEYGDSSETSEDLRARLHNLEFGNYPGYHKYRTGAAPDAKQSDEEKLKEEEDEEKKEAPTTDTRQQQPGVEPLDSRISFFRDEWFRDKEVLDVGCNRGHIAYSISRLFGPRIVVGIDIDLKIINMANSDLHLHLERELIPGWRELRLSRARRLQLDGEQMYCEDSDHFPVASYVAQGPLTLEPPPASDDQEALANPEQRRLHQFPNNIIFLEHNYVLASDELVAKQKPRFDTIVCLSVTKWVHLNYRDEGLKRFFRRMYGHLREGGLLILEAQPFDNYSRRKNLSDRLKANFYSIKFKPNQFDEYLLSEQVGFKRILHESVTEHICAGFKRPLKVFLK